MGIWFGWFIALLWTAGCVVLGVRLYKVRLSGEFETEHVFYGLALLLLAVAPYTSLLVYQFTWADHLWSGIGQLIGALALYGVGRRFRQQRLDPDAESASRSGFREKSAMLMFVSLAVLTICAVVFLTIFGQAALVSVVIGFVVLLVVAAIIGHTAIALLHHPIQEADAAADERDREVDLSSMRNAYYVLMSGIWAIPIVAIAEYPGYVVAILTCTLVLAAELVYYGSKVHYYRVGVQ